MSGKVEGCVVVFSLFLILVLCSFDGINQVLVCRDCYEGHGYYSSKHEAFLWQEYNGLSNTTVLRYFKRESKGGWVEITRSVHHGYCSLIGSPDSIGVVQQIRNESRDDSLMISFYTPLGEKISDKKLQIDWHLNITPLYFNRFLEDDCSFLITTDQHVGYKFMHDTLSDVYEDVVIDVAFNRATFWKDNPDGKSEEYIFWDVFNGKKYFETDESLHYISTMGDTLVSDYKSIHSIKTLSGEFLFVEGLGLVFRGINNPDD